MIRFNTEVLERMGFDTHVDGAWITIQSRDHADVHLDSVCERLYDAGLSEGEVDGVCGDIIMMVNERIIFKAMTRSGLIQEDKVLRGKKRGAP